MQLQSFLLVCSIATVYPTRDIISGVFQNLIPGNKKPGSTRNKPKPSYGAPKPSYGAPKPSYGAPKPSYGAPKPSGARPKPSYSAPKPSYGAPSGGGSKPRYKAQKPRKQKPRYKNRPTQQNQKPYQLPPLNLPAPTSSNLRPPSEQSYNSGQSSQSVSALTDQEMAALILSMHSMMQKIVASQGSSSATGVDSYGSPEADVLNTAGQGVSNNPVQAVSTYGGPVTGQSSNNGAQSSNNALLSSYNGAQSSNNGVQSANNGAQSSSNGAQSSYNGVQSSNNGAQYSSNGVQSSNNGVQSSSSYQGSSPSPTLSVSPQGSYVLPQASQATQSSYSSPVIKSTLEQIARSLAEYEAGNQNRNIKPRTGEGEDDKYKPVRFPRNPTVLEILAMLNEKGFDSMKEDIESKGNIEIPDLKVETFF